MPGNQNGGGALLSPFSGRTTHTTSYGQWIATVGRFSHRRNGPRHPPTGSAISQTATGSCDPFSKGLVEALCYSELRGVPWIECSRTNHMLTG